MEKNMILQVEALFPQSLNEEETVHGRAFQDLNGSSASMGNVRGKCAADSRGTASQLVGLSLERRPRNSFITA